MKSLGGVIIIIIIIIVIIIIIIIIIIIEFYGHVLAVVIAMFSSVRQLITNVKG